MEFWLWMPQLFACTRARIKTQINRGLSPIIAIRGAAAGDATDHGPRPSRHHEPPRSRSAAFAATPRASCAGKRIMTVTFTDIAAGGGSGLAYERAPSDRLDILLAQYSDSIVDVLGEYFFTPEKPHGAPARPATRPTRSKPAMAAKSSSGPTATMCSPLRFGPASRRPACGSTCSSPTTARTSSSGRSCRSPKKRRAPTRRSAGCRPAPARRPSR